MTATNKDEGTESSKTEQVKAPTGRTASSKGTVKAKQEPEREELGGVIHTSRIGPIEWTGASSASTPDQLRERRHQKLEEAKKPGDEGYSPYKDPMVPSSSLADIIAAELAAEDDEGKSPTWDALNEAHQSEHEEFAAMQKFREERAQRAS